MLSRCGEIVQAGDPDRFRTAMFAPAVGREHLFALYAFNLEIAKIAPMVSEPMLGEIRLQWWRETLDQIYGDSPVRKHEVATPLGEAVAAVGLPRAPLDALIDARAADLDPAFPASSDGLHRYISETAGGLTRLAATALAPDISAEGAETAENAGFAIGAARYLMAVPQMVAMGRKPLSMEMADALAAEGRTRLASAKAARGAIPKAATPALLEVRDAEHNLSAPTERSALRAKLSLYWRGARGRW